MRYSNPVPQLSDTDSKLVVGGKLYFYSTGTTTLKTIYSDSSLTIPQNNPVITDSSGSLESIFLDGIYKVVQKDDKDVQLWERDPVGKISKDILTADASGTVDAITAVFVPALTLTDEKTVIIRASGANTATNPTFSPDGLTAKTITKNGNQALAVGDIFGLNHSIILQYSSTNDVWELLNPALGAGVVNTTILADNSVTTAKIADANVTPAKLSFTVQFTEAFTSTEQTITAAGALTLAHSLSSAPSLIQCRLICKTADQNYSVNDELIISSSGDDSSASRGLSIVPDATNINIRFGSAANSFSILNKTTGAITAIINSRWKLIVKAWS